MSTVSQGLRSTLLPMQRHEPVVLLLALVGIVGIALFILALQVTYAIMPMIAIAALCLAVFVVVRPEVGFVAIILCAAIVKIEIGTGTGSAIVTSLLSACVLLVGWITHRVLHKRKLILLPRWLSASILMVVAFTFISWVWGHITLDPRVIYPDNFYRVQMAQAVMIIVSIGLLYVGADLFRSRQLRSLLAGSIIVIGMMDLVIRQVVPATSTGPISGTTFNTFGLFGLWFVALCWGNALLNSRLSVPLRLVLAGFAVGWLLYAIVVDGGWVSGWLPACIAMLVISFVAGPRYAVPFALGVVAMIASMSTYFYHLLITSQIEEGSIGGEFGRIELWMRNIEVSRDWLPMGSGPAGYALYYMTFIPDQAMSSHSNYIDLLSQLGVGGLLGFLSLLTGLLVLGTRTLSRVSDPVDKAFCAVVVGALPGLMLALWFGDWLIPFVYNQTIVGFNHSVYSWLMLAGLCGLVAQYLRQERADG